MGSDKNQLGKSRPGGAEPSRAPAADANTLIALSALDAQPWKNGGGTTYQIAVDPPGAGTTGFRWRISRAVIEKDGPFSAFPNVSRWITLISGPGFTMDFADGTSFEVTKPFIAYWFDGGLGVTCRLKDGRPATVINVMAQNDVVMRVNVSANRAALPTSGHAIISAFGASVRLDDRHVLTAAVDRPF
ncbi:HutD family protein [Ferrovibrio terrae]|jgi:environmental stress-induced protein Ves|uniref:HutD/Ves family protein n=1 Tax=Ferrovibrio terrae TaxID=2594003 RepID=UPI00313831D2